MTRVLTTAALTLLMLLSIALPWADFSQENYDDGLTSSQLDALREIGHTSGSKSIEPFWSWAERAGGSSNDYGYGIAVDSSGNAFVTGFFRSPSADFGSTTLSSSGLDDVFVAKLDSSGNWLWAERAGGSFADAGYGIAVDSSGNSYVTGSFFGSSADFGSTTLNSSGASDVFVAKLDSSGNWLWAERAGGSSADYGSGIAVDSSGNSYVTGFFRSPSADFGSTTLNSSGAYDVFVAKLDSSGNWLWAERAGGSSADYGSGIAVDSSGNSYVTGSFFGSSADFGSTTLNSSGAFDVFVAKLDSSGNWLWAERAGGSSADYGSGIAVDSSGNAYVTGNFQGSSADFGSTTLNGSGQDDVFVAKLDSFGNWLWAVRAGGSSFDLGYGIAVDSSGNAFVTGYFRGSSADFGSTTLNSSGASDVFVAKLDSFGNWLWAERAGGSSNEDYGRGIAVDSSDNAYVTGSFYGSPDFGSTTLNGSGQDDVFVAKLSTGGYEVELVGTMEPRASTTDISGVVTNTVDVGDTINFLLVVLNSGTLDITELYVSVDVSPTGTTTSVAGTDTPDGAVCDDGSNTSAGNPVCASPNFTAGKYLAYGSYAVRNSLGDQLTWTPSIPGEYTVSISLDPGDQDTDLTNNDLVFTVIVRDWYDIGLDLTWDNDDPDDTGENTGTGPHDFTLSAVVDGSAYWQPRNVDLEVTFGGSFQMQDGNASISIFEGVQCPDPSDCTFTARMGTPTSVEVYHNLSDESNSSLLPTMADRDVPDFQTAYTFSGTIKGDAQDCSGACVAYVSARLVSYRSYELVSTDYGGPGHEANIVNEMKEVDNFFDDRNGNNKDLLTAAFGVYHDVSVTAVTVGISERSEGGRLDAGNSALYATINHSGSEQDVEYDWEIVFDVRDSDGQMTTTPLVLDCDIAGDPDSFQAHANLGMVFPALPYLTVCYPLILDPGMYSITARVTLIDATLTNTDEDPSGDDDCTYNPPGPGTNPDCHVDAISANSEHTGYYEVVNNGPFVTLTMEVADGPIMDGAVLNFTAYTLHHLQPDADDDGNPEPLDFEWSVNTLEEEAQFIGCSNSPLCGVVVNNLWLGTPTVSVRVTDHWGATSTDSVRLTVWNSFSNSFYEDVDVDYDIVYYSGLPLWVNFSDADAVEADPTGPGTSYSVAAFNTVVSAILSPGDVYSEDMDVSFTGDSDTQYSLWYQGSTDWVNMPSTQSQVDSTTMMLSWSNDGSQPSRSSSTYAVFAGANIGEPPQTGITDLGHTLAPGGVISISWSVSDAASIGADDFGVIIVDGVRETFALGTTTNEIHGTHGTTYSYTVQVENGQSDQSGNRLVGSPVASDSATADGQVDPAAGASDLVAAEEAGNTVAFTWNVADDSDVDHWVVCWSIGSHDADEVQGLLDADNSCSETADKTASHVYWRPAAADTYHYSVTAVDAVGNIEASASSTTLDFPDDQVINGGDGTDTDGDGYDDESDDCPSVAGTSTEYGRFGCPDTDGDGWADVDDDCKTIPGNSSVEPQKGCTDSDGDGWANSIDAFPADHREWMDSDSDGVGDGRDLCPNTPTEVSVDDAGCTVDDSYSNVLIIGAGVGGAALGSGLLFLGIPRIFGRVAKTEEMTGRKMEDELWGEPTPQGPPTAEEMAIDEPANSLIGVVRDDGFEYIEWPPDSEDWWYRQHSGTGWTRWQN